LLAQVRERIRVKHYSLRTETAYVGWIKRYIHFHGKRHPAEMGKDEAEAFLTSLAVDRNVSAATQNQALSALLFLYREVLGIELPWLDDVTRAKKPARLPTVLTREETAALLAQIGEGEVQLIVHLLYGSGMRLLECLRLRVKDVDLVRREIVVRDGKGGKDRVTMIPARLVDALRAQLAGRRALHDADLLAGRGEVWLPDALAAKYPGAARAFGWQYVCVCRRRLFPRSAFGRGTASPC
jgi:integron integrase